jgi:hypothetical protein
MNIHLKNKGQESKTGPVWGWVPVCGVNREVKEDKYD